MAITAGLYELRNMLQTSMVVTGSGYTPVTGSNVMLWAWNEGNNRKWRLTQNSAGRWRLQNAANGLYMTLGVNVPVQGANVRQWTASTNAIQYWNIIETGEIVDFEGYTCPVVRLGNYYDGAGTTWMLDVDGAMTKNNTNMEVNRSTSSDSQKYVLVPTTLASNSYPVPAGLGWLANTNGAPYRTHAGQGATAMYLGWICPDNWVPNASRTFERRVRKRSMDVETSTWSAWSQWEQWADVDPIINGSYCYDANTLDASFDMTTTRAVEFQVEVRAKTSTTHGNSATNTVRNIVNPTATFTSAGASPEGFLVDVTSDYAPATYVIKSIMLDGAELLAEEVTAEILTTGTTLRLTIPWDRLLGLGSIPSSGVTATAYYTKTTDLFTGIGGGRAFPAELTLSYGTGPAQAPTIIPADGLTLRVEHPLGILGAWTSDGRGVYPTEDGELVVYPFGRDFDLLVAVGDGSIYHASMPAQDARPCHAFNWDGGAFILEHTTGTLTTSRTIKAVTSTYELDSRPWQTVTFAPTKDGELRAAGVLHDQSASGIDDLMALMDAQHATYRAPSGEVMHVAVTAAQYDTDVSLTEVSVTMTQETR